MNNEYALVLLQNEDDLEVSPGLVLSPHQPLLVALVQGPWRPGLKDCTLGRLRGDTVPGNVLTVPVIPSENHGPCPYSLYK